MSELKEDQGKSSPQCPKCKRNCVKLVSMNDNGTGKKVCIECKRGAKK